MQYYEDDTPRKIPDYINNMSPQELRRFIECLEEEARIKRDALEAQKSKQRNATRADAPPPPAREVA